MQTSIIFNGQTNPNEVEIYKIKKAAVKSFDKFDIPFHEVFEFKYPGHHLDPHLSKVLKNPFKDNTLIKIDKQLNFLSSDIVMPRMILKSSTRNDGLPGQYFVAVTFFELQKVNPNPFHFVVLFRKDREILNWRLNEKVFVVQVEVVEYISNG